MKVKLTKEEKFLRQLWYEPEIAIEELNLVYANEAVLKIKREKQKNDFLYTCDGAIIKDEVLINRILNLVIPPAWENVNISHLENTHLQATGRDNKYRKQYKYHPIWNKIRNQTKFYRMRFFGKFLPLIREQIDCDLNQKGWPKNKTLALVIKLMEETHIRIGSEQYAKRNKTYGLSTLRTKHLHVEKDKIKFEFIGKKGKKYSIGVRNKSLRHLVNKCQELPGWELFQFYDEKGNKRSIDSTMVNDYLYAICNEHFTAKDFRTWAASVVFLDTLYDLDPTEDVKTKDKNIIHCYAASAKALGNTRKVCRKFYVHPVIPESYKNGTIEDAFQIINNSEKEGSNFSSTERALLFLLKQFKPDFV
ncbi:DNA topoisomerase IB [Lacinutrix sp. Hel_I_90]|uniref:DNA topoisomerase IB n=1 Tax=Lacinutrix sp. Hel_I_90 TaxID=1249999 RepID=UPI0005C83B3F|nr:DNA topoisomerase IB [Lacinutrix sp. Hel_I_90]